MFREEERELATGRRPPGPKGKLLGGNFRAFRRDSLGYLRRAAAEHGDVVYLRFGPQEVFFLAHPDHVKDVLVTRHQSFIKGRALQRSKRLLGEGLLTSEHEFHRRQRRLAQPAFHRARINSYATVMTDYAARASSRWRDGEQLDISHEMMRLTLAIVARTLFDADVESEADEIGEALTSVMELFNFLLLPFSELLEKLPLPHARRFQRAKKRLDATIYRIIEERRQSNEDRGDLLSMLLAARDEEGDGGQMTDLQVRDEVMTIFLAGHETTANAMTWTWYLLSEHPEVEARLHEELDAVLAGREPTVEDVPRLRYTEMVLAESMRLYPPAWAIGRLALQDFDIAGYTIPPKALVLLSPYVTQRDERFYADPARFDPERWTPEAREARPQFAYFPFGGGPRRCIGEGFAWMEGILLTASLARRWRMRLVPGHPVEPRPVITLRPKHGMMMTVSKR
ncbi:MAG TPA: cytochrome P450 [Pyrinomonadaceae bacterium]|nr:cytochrome P450 [Pyrinomonadaceae bacterium]